MTSGNTCWKTRVVTYVCPIGDCALPSSITAPDQTAKNFLGVGGVIYSNPAAATSKSRMKPPNVVNVSAEFFDVNAVKFPDLPGSKQEVTSIAAVMKTPSQLLLDGNATESAIKALPIGDFGLITSRFMQSRIRLIPIGRDLSWERHRTHSTMGCCRFAKSETFRFMPNS